MTTCTGFTIDGPSARKVYACDQPIMQTAVRAPLVPLGSGGIPSQRDAMKTVTYFYHELKIENGSPYPNSVGVWSTDRELTGLEIVHRLIQLAATK